MRQRQRVFVDTGAWIALALIRDPLHRRAEEAWNTLLDNGARLFTSIPVVLETFTFLDRNASRDVALVWKDALGRATNVETLACQHRDLEASWKWFRRADLHKLSAVDATSFIIMKRTKIRKAFAFDHHFATAGFALIG